MTSAGSQRTSGKEKEGKRERMGDCVLNPDLNSSDELYELLSGNEIKGNSNLRIYKGYGFSRKLEE